MNPEDQQPPGHPFGRVPERNTADNMLRTAQQHHVQLSVMADIKANIQYLHSRILGEELDLTDPEIERTYGVFLETWKEGAANIESGKENAWLSWWCQARVDPNTQQDLPEAQKIGDDPNYTVRAWMAVITYLLSDYKFLFE